MNYRVRLESHEGRTTTAVEYGPLPDGIFTLTGHETGDPADPGNTLHVELERPDGSRLIATAADAIAAAGAAGPVPAAGGAPPGAAGEQVYGATARPAAPPLPPPSEGGQ